MKTNQITDEDDLRAAFWDAHPELALLPRRDGRDPRDVRQNSQPTDTRCAWVEFIDAMQRSGEISDDLADSATL